MRYGRVRYAILLIALSWPLGGCLEIVGAKMNRGASVSQNSGCAHGAQPGGETVGYGCAPAAPAAH